jgi:hypothetical protein
VITIISPGPFSLLLPGFSTYLDAHTKTKCLPGIGGNQYFIRIRETKSGGVLDAMWSASDKGCHLPESCSGVQLEDGSNIHHEDFGCARFFVFAMVFEIGVLIAILLS